MIMVSRKHIRYNKNNMPDNKPKILCIGTATQDVFLVGGKVFQPVCEHGVCYQHIPLGEKLNLDNVIFATGGNATNAAVTFARQGLHSLFMGVLGVEPSGQVVLKELDDEGIDARFVKQDARYKTGYSTILLSPTGERTILRYHGDKLMTNDLDVSAVDFADWIYVSSVGSMELLEKIVTEAYRRNAKVAFNPSNSELEHPTKLRALFEDISILIANKEEMSKLVEGQTIEELARHAANFVETAIVSDGPNGAAACNGEELVLAGMYEDVPVVDRTGAGDAFGSGFTAMIAQGKSLQEAVHFASANSTSVVSKIGAKAGILNDNAILHDMSIKKLKLQH